MKQQTLVYIVLFLGIFSTGNILGQSRIETEYTFSIKQTMLPDPNPEYEYVITNGQLTIYEININWKKEHPIEKKKKIYRTRLSENQLKSLDSILVKINIESLDSSYSNPILDGVYWTFDFKINDKRKKVILDNYYLKRLDVLLEYINKQIPEKKRWISFEIFDVKRDFIDNND